MTPSEEVDSATGEAPARVSAIQLLAETKAALDAAQERRKTAKAAGDVPSMVSEGNRIAALSELLPEREAAASVEREAEGLAAATDRLKKLKGVYGSIVASYQQDEARVATAAAALRDAIATLNARARKMEDLRAEADALSHRFEVTAPSLALVSEPQQGVTLPPFWRHHAAHKSLERCEHDLRDRRDYSEIGGSPGYAIITTCGLKPFRELTEQERRRIETRESEEAVIGTDQTLARAVTEANALGALGMPPNARVLRG